MGNAQVIIEKSKENQIIQELLCKGLINDELIERFYSGDMTYAEIHDYISSSISRNSTSNSSKK